MNLFSRIYGQGDPFIILHGLFVMSDNWNSIGKAISSDFEVHLLDLRNHGRSPHNMQFNYEVMTEDVKKYIKHYSLEKAIILGHSLGGKVAMSLASHYPELLKKMIIIDIAPKEYSVDFHLGILKNLIALNLQEYNSRKAIDLALQNDIRNKGVRLFLMKNLYRNQKQEFEWRFNISVLENQIKNISTVNFISEKIKTPTLFIKGENSDYITAKDYESINHYFPSSSIKVVKDAGHWVHAEQPLILQNILIEFIKE